VSAYLSYISCISSFAVAHEWQHLPTFLSHGVISNCQTKGISFSEALGNISLSHLMVI
jgi:hypothetical protein